MDALQKPGGVLLSEWQNERLEGKAIWCFLRAAWNAKQNLSSKALHHFLLSTGTVHRELVSSNQR